jgi:ABC-type Mn2+/Zn2+ transport system permease subunit
MSSFYIILGTVLWIMLAFWPAVIARRKGHSFAGFLILSLILSWLIGLIAALVVKDRTQTTESRANDKAVDAVLEKEENQ